MDINETLHSYKIKRENYSVWYMTKILFKSLFYNELCNFDYMLDCCFAPLYWFTDNYVAILGPSFVGLCSSLMFSIIVISYVIGLPYWWRKNQGFTIVLMIIGHWLMVNSIFNYYMGVTCKPGNPIQDGVGLIKEASGVCKKCIAPKPQRTHHCSICNTCILLMDHHCPWLNNCVGYFNRRYFFLYMAYIVASVIFLIIFGFEIAYKEVWLNKDLYGYTIPDTCAHFNSTIVNATEKGYPLRKRAIIFAALIAVGTLLALGFLLMRHIRLISKGETTIEMYINESETKRYLQMEKVYINPYNFGRYINWTLFLGIYNGSNRSWMNILFPSTHKPFGDGFFWTNIYSSQEEWEEFFHPKYS